MLSRLLTSLAQLKAGNNSKKLQNEKILIKIWHQPIYVFITHGKIFKFPYNNNKCKISAPTWNDEFDLPNRSYSISDIQYYFECIIKKLETIVDNSHLQIYLNKSQNKIVFKIKTGYKLELLSLEIIIYQEIQKKMLIKTEMVKMYQN